MNRVCVLVDKDSLFPFLDKVRQICGENGVKYSPCFMIGQSRDLKTYLITFRLIPIRYSDESYDGGLVKKLIMYFPWKSIGVSGFREVSIKYIDKEYEIIFIGHKPDKDFDGLWQQRC